MGHSPLNEVNVPKLISLLLRPFKTPEKIELFFNLFMRTTDNIAEEAKCGLCPDDLIIFLERATKPKASPKKAKPKATNDTLNRPSTSLPNRRGINAININTNKRRDYSTFSHRGSK
eukprot:GHVH01007325.1.p1 GENE.GHVH01007325.1~~GHVH01007325.1.p1  ORF type:complete len:117 (-),score=10.59 GHVH01007325.1:597-947(-)